MPVRREAFLPEFPRTRTQLLRSGGLHLNLELKRISAGCEKHVGCPTRIRQRRDGFHIPIYAQRPSGTRKLDEHLFLPFIQPPTVVSESSLFWGFGIGMVPGPSEEDIDQNRLEMFPTLGRDDIA